MKYTYWLACMPFGSEKKRMLVGDYFSAKAVYETKKEELERLSYLNECDVKALTDLGCKKKYIEDYEKLAEKNIFFCPYTSPEYPSRLRNIYNPPFALFYKGKLPKEDGIKVAVVGARVCSAYGQKISEQIGEAFGKIGIDVISGMARGVDSAAHYGALKGNGKTFAVLGCGVDIVYPRQNRELYNRILENGGVISEYAPGTPAQPIFFPLRNRIISGLSDVVIVTEAKRKSGSLITADLAMDQGREVFCVPGRVGDSLSEGTNDFIHQGAGIITSFEQLMNDLNLTYKPEKNGVYDIGGLSKDEVTLYKALDEYPKSLDNILDASNLTISTVFEVISSLMSKGLIKETFKNNYVRC